MVVQNLRAVGRSVDGQLYRLLVHAWLHVPPYCTNYRWTPSAFHHLLRISPRFRQGNHQTWSNTPTEQETPADLARLDRHHFWFRERHGFLLAGDSAARRPLASSGGRMGSPRHKRHGDTWHGSRFFRSIRVINGAGRRDSDNGGYTFRIHRC